MDDDDHPAEDEAPLEAAGFFAGTDGLVAGLADGLATGLPAGLTTGFGAKSTIGINKLSFIFINYICSP